MDSVENVHQTKDGTEKNVSVSQITLKLMEPAEHVIPTPITMAEIVSAITDSMEMLTDVINAMNLVVNALVLKLINASLAQMLAMISRVENVSEILLAQLAYS